MQTVLLSEAIGVPDAGIAAASKATGAYTTGAIDLGTWNQVAFLIDSGTLGSSATLDFELLGCATSGGSFTAISGSSITQITTSGEKTLVVVTNEWIIDLGLGYRYIKGQATVGTATSVIAVGVIASDVRFGPASNFNTTSVAQVLNLFRSAAADS